MTRTCFKTAVCILLGLGFLPEEAQAGSTTIPAPISSSAQASGVQGPEGPVEKSIEDLSAGHVGAAVHDDVEALRRGPLLIHGNYCGVGNRPGTTPIDALDAACMRHDACTQTGTFPTCACNDRLRVEATAIAEDPGTPPDIQALAAAAAAGMAVLICK